jgi:hypothetical protein
MSLFPLTRDGRDIEVEEPAATGPEPAGARKSVEVAGIPAGFRPRFQL